MNKDKIAKKRVQLGMQFLDAQIPNWESQIEVDILDLDNNDCILGQIYGCYQDAIKELGLHPRIATQMGFERSNTISNKRLTRIWKKALNKLLFDAALPQFSTEETVAAPKKKSTKKKVTLKKSVKKQEA